MYLICPLVNRAALLRFIYRRNVTFFSCGLSPGFVITRPLQSLIRRRLLGELSPERRQVSIWRLFRFRFRWSSSNWGVRLGGGSATPSAAPARGRGAEFGARQSLPVNTPLAVYRLDFCTRSRRRAVARVCVLYL